ncbi:hypothetical protein LXL04_032882 [Taraxacum kok-saghyz]
MGLKLVDRCCFIDTVLQKLRKTLTAVQDCRQIKVKSEGQLLRSSCGFSIWCELQTLQCDAVGSAAVVAVVTPEKIFVSDCGYSPVELCRNGVAIPFSVGHKPDRPDDLERIEEAGGRVKYWDGARVVGVLAMSRAIGKFLFFV